MNPKNNNASGCIVLVIILLIVLVLFFKSCSCSPSKTNENNSEYDSSLDTSGYNSDYDSSFSADEEEEDNSVDEEKTPIKIQAKYDGSKEAGTYLDDDNSSITVTATFEDGTTKEIFDYTIAKPVKLKAGKTSTVGITYKNLVCSLKVKCSTLTAKQYKQKCKHIPYKSLARSPEKYERKKVKFTGKIIQVMESDIYTCFRIDVTKGAYGIWDDTVYVEYWEDSSKRFLEDDVVTFYGKFEGLHTYETVLGASVTIPSVTAKYITLAK